MTSAASKKSFYIIQGLLPDRCMDLFQIWCGYFLDGPLPNLLKSGYYHFILGILDNQPYKMFTVIVLALVFLYIAEKILHLSSPSLPPILYYTASKYNNAILKLAPILSESYVPPVLWGKSGHIQTVVYGKLGRLNAPYPNGRRYKIQVGDGATVTFDLFEALEKHPCEGDYTMLVCPGIGNNSTSSYIRTFIDYAQRNGYRVVVLNHLGALPDVPLTAPRIFTYGGTEEYSEMVDFVYKKFPHTALIAVGFSMGANIVTKYLGEDLAHQAKILCAFSVCQGYDVIRAEHFLLSWEQCTRAYNWAITQHQKKIFRNHADMLFGKEAVQKYGALELSKVLACTSLTDIDEVYSRRRAGFDSLKEYYEWCSSARVINNIQIPMLILNTMDDPLIPEALFDIPRKFAMNKDNVIFAITHHGGHLGFFEGGVIGINRITWLEKSIIDTAHAHIKLNNSKIKLELM